MCSPIHHDPDALWRAVLVKPVGHFAGEPLLHLESPRVVVDDAGRLGRSGDAFARQIGDVGYAAEGQQVVFAQRVEADVAGEHELVIAVVVRKRRGIERRGGEQFGERTRHASTCSAG